MSVPGDKEKSTSIPLGWRELNASVSAQGEHQPVPGEDSCDG
jgi:hypothetical protein